MGLIKEFIKHSFAHYKTSNFYLADDTFNESEKKLKEFEEAVAQLEFKPSFCCYARLDLLIKFPNMINLLKNIGVKGIAFGIETFHAKAGLTIGKGTPPEKVKAFLLDLKSRHPDLYLSSGFIIGLPHEPLESCYETNEWLMKEKVLDSWNFNPLAIDNQLLNPNPSEFSKNIEKYDYVRKGNFGWQREGLDFEQAGQHSITLNQAAYDHSGPSPWILFGMLRKHTFESIRHIKISKLSSRLDIEKFDLYKRKLGLNLALVQAN